MKEFLDRIRPSSCRISPDRGLFIIGAARSGTTILQDALNHSREVCILGEPDLHMETGAPGFAARFNAKQRSWHNQETKATYLPRLGARDGSWGRHLENLAKVYRWVGAKVAVNPGHDPEWMDRFRAFHNEHFFTARYVFTFREPVSVIKSTLLMRGFESGDVTTLVQNYAEVLVLFAQMVRTMPNVRATFHEDMDAAAFSGLGAWLNVSLDGASNYYQPGRVAKHDSSGFVGAGAEKVGLLIDLYRELRRAVRDGIERPQIQQNDLDLYAGLKVETLGLVDSRARFLARGGS